MVAITQIRITDGLPSYVKLKNGNVNQRQEKQLVKFPYPEV